ncbi:hypothetical protein DFJ73DRAFT_805572 [Zopfochytrium polystomum]|nr:hypothetical protein DFJ73DRAFT_805572 [Zopfochytrium polystomum]
MAGWLHRCRRNVAQPTHPGSILLVAAFVLHSVNVGDSVLSSFCPRSGGPATVRRREVVFLNSQRALCGLSEVLHTRLMSINTSSSESTCSDTSFQPSLLGPQWATLLRKLLLLLSLPHSTAPIVGIVLIHLACPLGPRCSHKQYDGNFPSIPPTYRILDLCVAHPISTRFVSMYLRYR